MKKFRVVIVGCGSMAQTWVDYAVSREDTEIVALVDMIEENAKKTAEKRGLKCIISKDIKQAIKDSKANLVFDVTIPESHKNIVITALGLGCNVLGEKPMASTMEEAISMVNEVEKTGKMYSVMQNRRYLKKIRTFKEILTSNTIGEYNYICADFFLGPHFGGFRDIMESPLILDMAIHTFDQARFIMGKDPISVYCHEFNPKGSWYKGNAAAICIFEFVDGSTFCYRGSWCAEGAPTSWESSWRVMGSKGTAIWDGNDEPYAEVVLPSENSPYMNEFKRVGIETTWNGREGHQGCLDEMFNALKEDQKSETDCSDNIKSMSMVFGAIRSVKYGRKIMLM